MCLNQSMGFHMPVFRYYNVTIQMLHWIYCILLLYKHLQFSELCAKMTYIFYVVLKVSTLLMKAQSSDEVALPFHGSNCWKVRDIVLESKDLAATALVWFCYYIFVINWHYLPILHTFYTLWELTLRPP